jgi:hypothetical protein
MKTGPVLAAAGCVAVLCVPTFVWAQHHDSKHRPPAAETASVDFGVLPTAPLGPPPCAQGDNPAVAIGGPADPCSYKIHFLTPEEVTVRKGGEVSFQVHGGGHAIAIYEVSKNTTRDELGQFLCAGFDPQTISDPHAHPCSSLNTGAANAAAIHNVFDGRGDVVIVTAPGGPAHPNNRVWYEPGRLMMAGGHQFLLGTNAPAGQLFTYRFEKTGRYLVICANRSHFLNDWMFGFVNVTNRR